MLVQNKLVIDNGGASGEIKPPPIPTKVLAVKEMLVNDVPVAKMKNGRKTVVESTNKENQASTEEIATKQAAATVKA